MNKLNIFFYCSGGFGHIARAFSIIKKLPSKGIYTVATSEKWVFPKLPPGFNYASLPKLKSRIRFKNEEIVIENYIKRANDILGYRKHLYKFFFHLKKINPQLVVVDMPVEIFLFSKFLGYKTVIVYESLKTNELRWRLVWKNADKILAPYPKEFLEKASFPYLKKTFFSGGICRYDGEKIVPKERARKILGLKQTQNYILITVGKGVESEKIIKKICSFTKGLGYQVLLIYPKKSPFTSEITNNFSHVKPVIGVFEKINLYICASDLIITGTGYNSIMEAFYFRKPVLTIPLKRIYDEQGFKAEILSKMDSVVWVKPSNLTLNNFRKAFAKLSEKTTLERMKRAQEKIIDGMGSKRAAEFLVNLVSKKPNFRAINQT